MNEEKLLVAHHVGDVISIIQKSTHHLFDPDELLTVTYSHWTLFFAYAHHRLIHFP